MNNKQYKFNENNFDLIRLFAAFQVALHHSATHLKIEHASWLGSIINFLLLFPGVPIFFFISGFLISRSYEGNPNPGQYAQNRGLRLFPGLIVCGVVTTLSIYLSGYMGSLDVAVSDIFVWLLSQVTVFQFYDPDFLSGYGIGQANGSLWTIYIELQFYILVPILYLVLSRVFKSQNAFNIAIIVLVAVFYVSTMVAVPLIADNTLLSGLFRMSFVSYFYMFLLGVVFQRYYPFIAKHLEGKFLIVLAIYVVFYYLLKQFVNVKLGNAINPALYIVLCCLVFSAAFSARDLSRKVLGHNDISYGIYIYHMPIVNFLIYNQFLGTDLSLLIAMITTLLVAILSWVVVERPSMKMKKKSLNPLGKN
ncbi:acyltransferase family protein [Oceanicoccus sagamiensis]|uniref:Acyltransferase 3 domain-containing protein n=1 Tax=Oceanicoccus sagamiensis TaxID=716816 RepID=A0A1X9NGM6_9GAMM|nr:acyltransferase [Oceanicoccus sagamiensis]ARN74097.1 hypothetical protein BST96_08155 [Oceanicoccus sagamiensis]